MKQPLNTKQNFSSNKTKIILVIIFLAILLLAFGILLGLVLRQSGFQLSMPAKQTQVISTVAPTSMIPQTSVAPTIFVLTPLLPLTTVDSEPIPVNPSPLNMLILASSISADQATVTLDVKLTNQGLDPITLTDADMSVMPENGNSAPPSAVTPSLPQEIPPGESLSISVSFPNPKTPSVVLRILDVTQNYPLP